MNAIPFASMPARYPLTSTLISTIEDSVQADSEVMLRAYWQRWTSWCDNSDGPIKELLSNPNPAVVLSLPYLYLPIISGDDCTAALYANEIDPAQMLGGRNIRSHLADIPSATSGKLSSERTPAEGFEVIANMFKFLIYYSSNRLG